MAASPLYFKEKVKQWNQQVSSKPMTTLSGDELAFFAFKVGYTWGNISDYKHFLPRFFELFACYEEGVIETWLVFKKLNYFKWETWDQREQEVILSFIENFWIQLLEGESFPYQFEEHFKSIIHIHPSPAWILQQWYEVNNIVAIEQYCDFIIRQEFDIIRRGKIKFIVQDENQAISNMILEWSQSKMLLKLEKWLFISNDIDDELANKMIRVIDILSNGCG